MSFIYLQDHQQSHHKQAYADSSSSKDQQAWPYASRCWLVNR